MKIKQKLTSGLMVMSLGLVSAPLITTAIISPTNVIEKDTKAWADVTIDGAGSKVNFTAPKTIEVVIKIDGLGVADTPTAIAAEINAAVDSALTVKGNINGVDKSIVYGTTTNISDSAIEKDGLNNANITLSYEESDDVQTLMGVQAAVNKDAEWNWVTLGSGDEIINGVDVSDGTAIMQDETKDVTTSGLEGTKATIDLPLKYDDTKVLAGDLSYLVVQESIKDLAIKANDTVSENTTPTVSNPNAKADGYLNTSINLINLKEGTTYENFIVDLDGDWLTTDDQITLTDFSFQTTSTDDNGLSGGAIAGIIIGVLILIALIGAGGYLVYKKQNQ